MDATWAGFTVTQSLGLVNFLQYGIKQLLEVVSHFASVERALEYTNLPLEIQKVENEQQINELNHGTAFIELKNVFLKYGLKKSYVLQNINLSINSGEKVFEDVLQILNNKSWL